MSAFNSWLAKAEQEALTLKHILMMKFDDPLELLFLDSSFFKEMNSKRRGTLVDVNEELFTNASKYHLGLFRRTVAKDGNYLVGTLMLNDCEFVGQVTLETFEFNVFIEDVHEWLRVVKGNIQVDDCLNPEVHKYHNMSIYSLPLTTYIGCNGFAIPTTALLQLPLIHM